MSTPIDTAQPFYLQSQVGTTVNPDFQGGTLRDDQNNATDSNAYTVENFPTNTIDAFGHTTTFSGTFSGAGPLTIASSAPNGTVVVTGDSALGGVVTIDSGATMQWGAGNPAFLVGGGNAVVDNGALVMNFGGGGVGGAIPISGAGTVKIQAGSLGQSGASTYTGVTTLDAGGFLNLSGTGSIADSSNVIDNGEFDISGTTAGASITTLNGSGGVSLGAQTLTLTAASGTFSGVMADGGLFGGTGGGLTIAGGTEILTGTNTYTGATTINTGAALQLGDGGTTGTVAGAIVDNGLVFFNDSGPVTAANPFSGGGSAVVAGTVVITAASSLGGVVVIDNGATMQWGAGNPAFLVGGGNAVVDDGALVMNFGPGSIGGPIPILGTGRVEFQTGALTELGASTYNGVTTIDAAGSLALSGTGSIADSSNVIDNGKFDISGTTAGASITTLNGSGGVSLGGQTLTLTAASGTFSGVMADGGLFGGTGGALTIAGGTETLTGTNTFTGATTIDLGATLKLRAGGGGLTVTGTVAGAGTLAFTGGAVALSAGAALLIAKVVQSGGTVNVNTSLAYAGVWSQSAGTLAVATGRTLTLSGSSDSFAGTVAVAGTLADHGVMVSTGTLSTAAKGEILVANGSTLQVQGVVANAGTIDLASAGSTTELRILAEGATLSGGGTVKMAGAKAAIAGVTTAATLVNVNDTIVGEGFFGVSQLTLDNEAGGVIEATGDLVLGTAPKTLVNAGRLEAVAGGTLVIAGTTVANSGTILAAGGRVDLQGSDIVGGTLAGTGGGLLTVNSGSSTLDGSKSAISLTGELQVDSGTTLTAMGSVTGTGSLDLFSGRLVIGAAGLTLSGKGQVNLDNATTNVVTGISAAAKLTNVNDRIAGAGLLGHGSMILVNEAAGIITDTQSKGLTIDTGAEVITNAGTIAGGIGGVTVASGIANTGELFVGSGTLTLNGAVTGSGAARIVGGVLIVGDHPFAETVVFAGKGTLELKDAVAFTGKVAGLSTTGTNALDLADIAFKSGTTKASYSGTKASGVLTVTDGTHTAKISLTGNYLGATFNLSNDGHGGTKVVDPTTSAHLKATLHQYLSAAASFEPPTGVAIGGGGHAWLMPPPPLTRPGAQVA